MTTQSPQSGLERENGRDRNRRDWLIFLLLLLLGFGCLLVAAQLAVRPDPTWQVRADMLSEIDPGEDYTVGGVPIAPLRPEVMTPPWDPDTILTPEGSIVAVPTAVLGPAQTGTATPGGIAVATPSPSVTATPSTPTPTPTTTSTPTATPTSSPTPTTTPTSTPTPSTTPTTTPTPTSTPTNTPEPPPPPTNTPTPVPPTNTPTLVPPPVIYSITPDQGENSADVPVVIQGANFFGTPTVQLGSNTINVTGATATTINATVPAGLTPGVYALIVTNPDAQFDVLPSAYTVLNPPSPNTTLETGYLSIFGPTALGSAGDDDHVQLIFFAVPSTITDSLYFRIFDADTGGGGPTETLVDKPDGSYNTTITYTLRGYTNTYTNLNARSHRPNAAGINSGTLLTQTVVGADSTYHDNWNLVFGPYPPSAGELVGGSRVFKLAVEGASGNDDNAYNVALSTNTSSNVAPAGSHVFAYSWTFPLTSGTTQWLYPYVSSGLSNVVQHNWDMDDNGTVTLHTPMRDGIAATVSANDSEASSSHAVQTYEDGAAWTVTMGGSTSWNDLTFWAVGDGADLAIFTRPTTGAPP